VDELAKVVEGPMGHLADAYERDMEQIQARVSQLETSSTASAPATQNAAEASKPAEVVKPAKVAKPEVTGRPATAPSPSGSWLVYLSSSDEKKRAEGDLARARATGISAEMTSAQMGGKTWYRVTVPGFATAEEARAYVAREAAKAGFGAAWIGR
jgi:cell division protein FtsN